MTGDVPTPAPGVRGPGNLVPRPREHREAGEVSLWLRSGGEVTELFLPSLPVLCLLQRDSGWTPAP